MSGHSIAIGLEPNQRPSLRHMLRGIVDFVEARAGWRFTPLFVQDYEIDPGTYRDAEGRRFDGMMTGIRPESREHVLSSRPPKVPVGSGDGGPGRPGPRGAEPVGGVAPDPAARVDAGGVPGSR